jgi:ABC-2 type transport system ATP-binding protein
MDAIEISGLRKVYGGRHGTVAVQGLDLSVPEGSVFGLLGPNGSGKTTTLRCLIGLVAPTSGTCRLLGSDSGSATELGRVIDRVGSVVEKPAFLPSLSARRHLELLGRLAGFGRGKVEAALERVGLADRADDPVRSYSLGMLQRLGIAAALLKDPAVLILDEPANGLDPAGIVEIRDLLRQASDEGRTVLVSSHLLSEIEQACDRIAILSRGRSVASGTLSDVLAAAGTAGVLVRLDEPGRAVEALRAAGLAASVEGGSVRVSVPPSEGSSVSRALAAAGLYPSELTSSEVSLESVFLALTRDDDPERSS